MTVRLLHCRPAAGRKPRATRLIEVVADADEAEGMARFLSRWLPARAVWQQVKGTGTFLVWTTEPELSSCRWARRQAAICLSCPLATTRSADGSSGWTLIMRGGTPSIRRALQRSISGRGDDLASHLESVRPFTDDRSLTARQETAVRTALDLGYFDLPRKAGLPGLSKALGIGRSAAHELLLRGLGKIVVQHARLGEVRIDLPTPR